MLLVSVSTHEQLANILECEGRAHFPCKSGCQSPNLCVDVSEVRQGRPPANSHDGAVRGSS